MVSDQGATAARFKLATHCATVVGRCHGIAAKDGEGVIATVCAHGASQDARATVAAKASDCAPGVATRRFTVACAQGLQNGVATPQYLGEQDLLPCSDASARVHGG
jgi:hypothetical protein